MKKSNINGYQGRGLTQLTGRGMGNWSLDAIVRLKDDLGPYRIKLSEYDIYGETYHAATPVGWMLDDKNITWKEILDWVTETFGPTAEDGVWSAGERWYANNSSFYFRNLEDRDWFLLRWSH
jgi:hypothetical protein